MAARERLPDRRRHGVVEFAYGGHHFVGGSRHFHDGRLAEVFLDVGRVGWEVALHAHDAAILVSLLLQHGVESQKIRHSINRPISTLLALLEDEAR